MTKMTKTIKTNNEQREVVITIPERFPTANEYIDDNRRGYHVGARTKKTYTEIARIYTLKTPHMNGKCDVNFEWHVLSKADPDNIDFARKFILDGLQASGVLKGDSQKYIGKLSSTVVKDKNVYVRITLRESE
ncbi:hypothetical protein [Megasphaera vaginalis (ex Srinivasan et al. 2021)]|uniref:hypothetical protein n=1 Tax=Megasphaera vaginalis (ex Srinivasan et al. 2021) TaxID=1111454 RepID=UPI000683E21F|nr:hypothetical protein [Megasphaera vaginalis (ex Srinivasan et al. 2021)]